MNEEVAKPKRRWLIPTLFVSLAFNLLIVGIFVGFVASPNSPRNSDRNDGHMRSMIGEPFVRALPRQERQALIKAIRAESGRLRENRDALRARFEALLVSLRASPFEPEAVARLLQEQSSVAVRRQQIGEEILINRLAAMSPNQRATYADQLAHALRRLRRD
ncbi:MAG: periplasmic heavy metal sensor [Boseongicola sp.]